MSRGLPRFLRSNSVRSMPRLAVRYHQDSLRAAVKPGSYSTRHDPLFLPNEDTTPSPSHPPVERPYCPSFPLSNTSRSLVVVALRA